MNAIPAATLPDGVGLRITGLTKQYGSLRALDGVSFEVRTGEVLGVIGPNGSGKTTLFECVGGVRPFDSGEIERASQGADCPVFYLPDGIAPWPAQTVGWTIDYVAGAFGAGEGARNRVVDALAMAPLLGQRVGQLSKGQRKRVLLAVGLLIPRPIVFADEPFDGLDLRQTREMAGALRSFARDGRTLVLSIHQIADAARVCDRFVLLSHGTVRFAGTMEQVMTDARARDWRIADLEEAFLALT
jgi:ABC-2 type transport system ATP-binding protein